MQRLGVIFVCLGNICRSPMAKGLFQARVNEAGLADRFFVDSAGTSAYHIGEPPDPGSVRAAERKGVDLSGDRARQVTRQDLERFEYVIALDSSNQHDLHRLAPAQAERVRLLREFEPNATELDVPDPWGRGFSSFVDVCEMIERAADGLLQYIQQQHPELR